MAVESKRGAFSPAAIEEAKNNAMTTPAVTRTWLEINRRWVEYDCLDAPQLCGTVLDVSADGTRHWDGRRWHRVERRKAHVWTGKETSYQ